MKTIKIFLAALLLLAGIGAQAQPGTLCGVDAKFGYRVNPSNFFEFKDSTQVNQGWQVMSYQWKFGDGQGANVQNPSHFYSAPGTYTACLIVVGKSLTSSPYVTCIDTFCTNITVTPCNTLYIGFQQNVQGATVTFSSFVSNNAAPPVSYSWNFGDGTGSHDPNPVHTYAQSGVYNVCLTVEDANGCRAVRCVQLPVTTANSVPCGLEARFGRAPVTTNNLSVYFIDSSKVAPGWQITSYQWKFGDGNSSNLQNPMHTYTAAGTYTVCLIISGENPSIAGARCSDTICKPIVVGCNQISGSFNFTVNGSTVTFQSSFTSNNNPLQYLWRFGDGTTSTDPNPTKTYSNGGTYNICVVVKDAANCLKEFCKQVIVTTNVCANVNATFTINTTSTGSVILQSTTPGIPVGTLYQWWMDGQALNNPNPNSSFTITNVPPGSHSFCLYLYVVSNTTTPPIFCDSTCRREYIGPPTNPCNGAQANFTFNVNGNNLEVNAGNNYPPGTGFQWRLNGHPTNISPNNIHYLYTGLAVGNYRLCLFIFAPTLNGNYAFCDSLCKFVSITGTNPCTGISAAWTYSYLQNNAVKFTPSSNPTGSVHAWSFGDGTTSGDVSPTKGYTAAGLYRVCHYIYIPGTNCKDSSCAMIQVNAVSLCHNFAVSIQDIPDLNGGISHTLKANVNSMITIPVTYVWSTNATTQSIRVDSSGTYCVTATQGNCTASACVNVNISPNPCTHLNAGWTQTYTNTGCVMFKPAMNVTGVKHQWYFGDGTSSTNVDPVHCYAASGLYNVCHIVSLPGTNCADTVCRSIQANGTAICQSGFTYTSAIQGNTIYFQDASHSNDSIVAWQWNFGDGNTSNAKNPVHQYAAPGKYYVCHTIKTANNCTSTKCDSVKVGGFSNNCRASFLWEAVNCLTVRFKNTSSGGFNKFEWNFGDGTSDTVPNPLHTYTSSGTYRVRLIITGPYCRDTFHTQVILPSCVANDTICGVVFEDLNSNGVLDNNERGLMGVIVLVDNVQLTTDSNGRYYIILPRSPHSIKAITPTGCMSTMPQSNLGGGGTVNYYGYHVNGTGGKYCGYNFGINCNIVRICGIVFHDANNNGTRDTGENGLGNIRVILKNSSGRESFTFTNNNGEYCVTLPADTYNIRIVPPSSAAVITPSSITLNATTPGQNYNGNDFAVYRQPGICDLKIDLVAHACVSPGFPAYYSVQVRNIGTEPSGGEVHLFYDPALRFNFAAPAQMAHNASTRTITWNLPILQPGQFANFWGAFTANIPLQINQFVFTLADVNPACTDVNFANNIDTTQQLVRSSWDPNNKLVNPMGKGPQGLIKSDELLTYTINFQNTGNAPAVNVVLRDLFTDELDLNTMEMLASSHPYSFQIEGREGVWKFSGIMLPDSGTNEPASHGFVMFSIKPNAGLPEGTEIFNHADIYFDYNEAVITEPTLNTIDYKTSVEELTNNNVTITLMPNPFREFTTIKIEGTEAPYEIRVYDLLGKLISSQIAHQNTFTIQRSTLTSGVYLYEVLKQNQTIGKGKMIATE